MLLNKQSKEFPSITKEQMKEVVQEANQDQADIMKQSKEMEELIKEAYNYYLGERKNTIDCEPLIKYLLPKLKQNFIPKSQAISKGEVEKLKKPESAIAVISDDGTVAFGQGVITGGNEIIKKLLSN